MTPHRWTVASTLLALAGLPIGAVAGAAPSPSLAILSLQASPPPTTPQFAVSDLGTLGGSESTANSVNDLSQAVGSFLTASGAKHAFLFREGQMTDLGTLSLGNVSSVALGLNSLGYAVGNSLTAGQQTRHAFLYNGSGMMDLGTLGGSNSSASAINDAGDVVGYSDIPVQSHSFVSGIVFQHAFLYSNGKMSDLRTLSGPNVDSAATSINAIGQVVGSSFTGVNSPQHAFLYNGSGMMDLGTLGGPTVDSAAAGINAIGQVVGKSLTGVNLPQHAFLYRDGKMSDLGTLGGANSAANGINTAGQVVGESDTASGGEHAFLWAGGVMVDLNSLIPPESGWELQSARGISDGGEIVGSGIHNGQPRAFFLTPTDAKILTLEQVTTANAAIGGIINQLGINPALPRITLLRFNYMTSKLQVARQQLDLGKRSVALNLLQSFVMVGSTLTDRELSPDKKQLLMNAAQAVIAQLEGEAGRAGTGAVHGRRAAAPRRSRRSLPPRLHEMPRAASRLARRRARSSFIAFRAGKGSPGWLLGERERWIREGFRFAEGKNIPITG